MISYHNNNSMHEMYTLQKDEFPFLLKEINDPPSVLYVKGKIPNNNTKMLCIVGARKHSSYGENACRNLIQSLKGQNICIVSGLALGIDGIAHKTALEIGLKTIAFPGSGLDEKVLYPSSHRGLANEILKNDGALISEFNPLQEGTHWTFPKRNRLMAGISHATIVIEAELISGTLITSKLASEYNRDVGAVPGSIFSSLSEGPNMLINIGAKVIRNKEDILQLLEIADRNNIENNQLDLFKNIELSEIERTILNLLKIESNNSEQLSLKTKIRANQINEALSSLEIKGLIKENLGIYYPIKMS